MRTRTGDASAVQHQPRAGQRLGDVVERPARLRGNVLEAARGIEQVEAGEFAVRVERRVAVLLDAEPQSEDVEVVGQQRAQFLGAPRIERPLHRVRRLVAGVARRDAVGVLGRIEAAFRAAELARDIPQRVFRDLREERIAAGLRGFEVREDELRLVVEHLFEVRHTPVAVHRIAMKAAADVVAHAAERHRAQRLQHHVSRRSLSRSRVFAQQEQELARPRELRRVAEPAAPGIEGRRELPDGDCKLLRPGDRVAGRGHSSGRRGAALRSRASGPTGRRAAGRLPTTRAIDCSTSVNPGMFQRLCGGKYVPP